MPQVKTYGKKAASKKIWQLEGPAKEVEVKEPAKSVPHKSKDINVKPKLKDVNVDIRGVEDDPINDLVAGLTKVALDEAINPPAINESGLDHVESKDAQNVQSAQTALAETLTMLKDEHDLEVNVTSWETALRGLEIRKEAEASFSQVFTATNTSGKTSILKVIELKLSTDGKSLKRDTAISLETIMPEILITECLSQLVGFVENKAVHVLVGRPSPSIAVAYSIFAEQNETQFPLPSSYSPRSAFLLLEQDHAGMVLEEFPLLTCQDMTDVLLETITHLGIAERFLQFEHRDLHENNICVRRDSQGKHHVTILDYGLSRVTSGTSTFFANLEEDLDVFRATDDENRLAALQFSTYRRMRRIQITHDSKPEYRGLEYWPDEPGTPDWARHNPYNNVLWIHYLCCFLRWGCRRPKRETTRFEKNLHPILAAVDPSNRSAQQVDSVWQLAQLAAEHNLLNLEEFTDFDNVASEQDVSAIEQVMVRRKKRVSDAAMVDSAAESAKSQEARERPMTRSRSGRGRDVTRRARHRARDVE